MWGVKVKFRLQGFRGFRVLGLGFRVLQASLDGFMGFGQVLLGFPKSLGSFFFRGPLGGCPLLGEVRTRPTPVGGFRLRVSRLGGGGGGEGGFSFSERGGGGTGLCCRARVKQRPLTEGEGTHSPKL